MVDTRIVGHMGLNTMVIRITQMSHGDLQMISIE